MRLPDAAMPDKRAFGAILHLAAGVCDSYWHLSELTWVDQDADENLIERIYDFVAEMNL